MSVKLTTLTEPYDTPSDPTFPAKGEPLRLLLSVVCTNGHKNNGSYGLSSGV